MSQAQSIHSNQKYEKLKNLLKELFQLDQPDLDFGLYRIMHAKSAEITQFLDNDLLPQVKQAFSLYKDADSAELQIELAKKIEQAQALGADPETLPKVKELRDKLANEAVDLGALENEVYDHLFSFFRRYYSEGDFLAKRVYKPGVYAVPYEGEEVKFYWANSDQYYIKTNEYLRDYAFCLRPDDKNPMRVHFMLADATEGEHGNVQAAEGKERAFVLASDNFIAEVNGDLAIRFEYRPPTISDWPADVAEGKQKPPSQKDLVATAVKRILALADGPFIPWLAELAKTDVNRSDGKTSRNILDSHLNNYVAKNTFDYFIHKDLAHFLRRELDFYIKNEVMHLDDVAQDTAPRVEQYLSKIKVIRSVAGKIIDFLSQLENFQKRLWLKKKFVVDTQFCITISHIPDAFYPEIAANDAQREEWVGLLAINEIENELTKPGYSVPLNVEFLKAHPTLMVDTRLFETGFTARLLEQIGDLDEKTDGVLFHSENFQALFLMQARYRQQLKCVYIDPPYNTDASPIVYKNGYRRSTWASLMADRLELDARLRVKPSLICIAIDDFEYPDLQALLDSLSHDVHHATVAVRSKPQGRPTATGFSANHEYAVFWGTADAQIGRLPRNGSKADRYPHSDEKGIYSWANFRKSGTDSDRTDRRKSYYPVYVADSSIRFPDMVWNPEHEEWKVLEQPLTGEVAIWPIDPSKNEKVWTCSLERARVEIADIRIERDAAGRVEVYKKYRPNQDGALPGTWWDDSSYSASESGTKVLKDMFGVKDFDYPKSINLVADSLRVCNATGVDQILDYFAGSGTTGHAVINLNREDGGRRKFILVEMGDYFETVLLPRLKKITFAPEWKDAKPTRLATPEEAVRGPRIVKVVCLESYEDALNNLETRRSAAQQSLLDVADAQGTDGLKEQYLLRYMLDVETIASQSLLNVPAFSDPTSYTLKVKRPGSERTLEATVDLLETFNWLIGIAVQHIAAPQSFAVNFERDSEKRLRLAGKLKQDASGPWWFRRVEGSMPDGKKTLIVWRKLTGDPEEDNLVLDVWMKDRLKISTKDFEFDLIYVNGGNNLENLKLPDDTWKVRLIEEDFHRLMFDTENL